MKRWSHAFGAVLLLLAGIGLVHAADPIKIGSFLTVTGPASFLGDPELKTLQMYVEELNAKGGVKGRKLELIHYDTGGNAKDAVNFVKRLIKNDNVDLLIGGTTTGDTMAVIPDVEKEGIPFISLAGGVEIIEPVKKWVFKTPHTDRMAAAKIFGDLRKRGLNKIALITGDGGFDKSGRAQILKLAPDYGITLVADESYGNKDTDMTAQLTKIRSSDAQAIINFGLGQAPAIVTKNIKQLGITLPLYQSHGVASKTFIDLAGDAAEGVRLPAAALVVAAQLPDADPQKPVLLAYQSRYEAKHGPVSTFGGHAYDGLMIAVAAIERAGGPDKAKVRDEIEKTSGSIGTAGVFNMSPQDHMGLNLDAFKLLEIRNGAWKIVD
ncbi:MAG TPA: ABC transporter substrate-binding protein [Candidatus Competibacter sp.]|nr:ABC transporter substrate-binding protein [Candidatus Competibacteraceae bacterium]HRE54802.1 ABC transporter substrate-binding protein [Candidatus Competibacter sp.]HUM94608.1 ABC transporter substrate-binding protein [Candidatus Competibacter sp.]